MLQRGETCERELLDSPRAEPASCCGPRITKAPIRRKQKALGLEEKSVLKRTTLVSASCNYSQYFLTRKERAAGPRAPVSTCQYAEFWLHEWYRGTDARAPGDLDQTGHQYQGVYMCVGRRTPRVSKLSIKANSLSSLEACSIACATAQQKGRRLIRTRWRPSRSSASMQTTSMQYFVSQVGSTLNYSCQGADRGD
jgi:hypothetical protein